MTTPRLTLALVVGLTVTGCAWKLGGSEETAPPTLTAVDPPLGNNGMDVRVTVLGTGFFRLLVRDLDSESGFRLDDTYEVTVGGVSCRNVVRLDDEHLVATIPAGLAEGPHDVVVTSPARLSAVKDQGYYATSAEAPVLTDISPSAAVNDAAQVVSVSGTGLRPGAQLFAAAGTVEVVDIATAIPFSDDPAGTQTATLKQVIVPAGLPAGPYTVAVKNPDGQRAQLSGVFQVVTPATLQLALSAPAQVSVGQTFSVTGTVTNAGGSDAEGVALDPATVQGTGGATVGATSTPPSTTVPSGGSGALVLTAQATREGTLSISSRAVGANAFSLRPLASGPATTGTVQVQRAAALSTSVSVAPASTASVNQTLTVTVQVTNTGEAAANGVAPSVPVLAGGGVATFVSGPAPASADIPGGSSTSFGFTYTATAPGALTFSSGASGADANSAQAVTSAPAASTPVQIQTRAELSIISFSLPGTISRGQTFTATMVVANTGQAAANAVLPVPSPPAATLTGGASASTSTAQSPVTIPGGGSATFVWTYAETGSDTGTIALVAAAAGTDANTGARVSSSAATSNTAAVQASSDLRITSFALPSALTTGQTFTGTLTVQNFGGTTANAVLPTPNPPDLTATGGAGATTSSTVLPAVIPPSGTATFVWTYTVTGTGTISLNTGASGVDAVTGGAVNAAAAPSNVATVVAPSGLTITSFSIPASLSRGQTFIATMQVQNNGGATALGVVPDPPTVTATGGAGAVTSTSLTPADIGPGGTASFTWTYVENGTGPGTISLAAGASGTDGVTGNPVTANATSTGLSQVQDSARLQVSSFTLPVQLSRGQGFDAVMVVRNLGQAPASGVLPAPQPPAVVATGGAGATTATTFTPRTIPGGGTTTFTWAYGENGAGPGTLALNGGAAGTDANSGAALTAPAVDSTVATVQAPARLQVTQVMLPARLSRGQTFTAQVTVTNLGEATATAVLPSPSPPALSRTGGANASTASTPAPVNIPAGQSATFLYSYIEDGTGTGTITLATGAAGTDANSGQAVTAPQVSSSAAVVESPAALSVTSFTLPANVSRGSTFSAVLVVSNAGEVTARGVLPSPNPPALTSTGQADAATSTTLVPQDIPGGGAVTFTWTYTENGGGSGNGTLRLTTGAAGTDANSGAPVAAAAASSNTAAVQAPAALSITSFTVNPAVLSRGQTFTATMVVRNTGQATATGVLPSPNPPSVSGTGGASATTSTPLSPATIASGATASFTWTFTENGTGPGTLVLASGASGTDANSGQAVAAPSASTTPATVQSPPQLAVTSLTLPPLLSLGQSFNVTVVVSNTGQATATSVLPSPDPPALARTGAADASTSSSPAPATIAGGASASFVYSYTENGTGPGTLQLSAGAVGTDANSGQAVSGASVSSAVSPVQAPAALQVTTFTIPATLSRGQTFTATAVVTNTGQATATGVLPSPTPPLVGFTPPPPSLHPDAVCTGTPAPATVAGGATASFSWSCTENGSGTGTLTLSTGATGTDANSGAPVSGPPASSTTANVQEPGTLRITAFSVPATVTRGQAFQATMTVQNPSTTTTITNVLPSPAIPTLTRTGGADATTGTTFSPRTLAPGASTTFVWNYLETGSGSGTLTLTGGASGNDGATGVNANPTSTNLAQAQTAPLLSVTAFTLPAQISSGQTFLATMTVSNSGQATATGVLPSPDPPAATVTGSASATTTTTLTAATIPGGGSATFTWTYRAGAGTGTFRLTAGASGTDINSGAPVSAASASSNTATMEAPAQLSVTSFTAPPVISRGQAFTLTMVVRNTGSAAANGVRPSPNPPSKTVTGGADATTATSIAPVNIAGGATATFSWTYTENGTGAGTLAFTAGASGSDANSGAAVSAPSAVSNTVSVQTPPQLQVTSFTLPSGLSRGQTFQASMTVANNGQATASNVLPSPNPPTRSLTGGANATTGTALTPASIAGGSSATFTWTYTENGTSPGTIALSAGASGTDANSGAAVSAGVTSSNTATVQTRASLTVTSLTLPPRLSRGQTFTATMVVANTGQASATSVLPSPDPPTQVVTGGAAATTSTPHTGVTIAGGSSATITWTYVENGAGTGTLALRGGASGTDANSGAALSAAAITSAAAVVEQPAALQVTSFTIPASLSRGQGFTAVMVVTNTGQAAANGVLPSPNPPSKNLTGGADATTSTVLSPATIPGGSSATFTWTYTENGSGPGTLQLSGGAAGTDADSGATVSAPSASTGTANVVSPAALVSTISGPPAAVAGDQFAVKMLVTNTGTATANAVTPSSLAPTTTGTVSLSLLSSPLPVAISGGSSATFVWTYSTSAASSGTVRFSGNATGTDVNSGASVSSASSSSNVTTILTPAGAGLTSTIVTRPRAVPVGDLATVEMSVTNQSGGTRNGVAPSDLTLGGTGVMVLVSGPAPATLNLLAGASGTFSWTYRAAAQGWVTFTGNATSSTPPDASARSTSPALAIPSPSCSVSTLAVNAGPDRPISCNQNAALGGSPTASGGNPSYVYEWTPATNVSNPAFANPTASPRSSPAMYTVTVTDGDGCRLSDSMVVTVLNAPSINSMSSGAVEDRRCTGSSFGFAISRNCPAGGCSNAWDFGDGTTSGSMTPTKSYGTAGTYYVSYTVTDGNGCRASRVLPVFVGNAGVYPAGRIQLTASPASVAADGTATVTFTSQTLRNCGGTAAGAGSGMRFLVDTDRGTITDADVDPATPGIQMDQVALGGGNYGVRFTVRSDRVGGPVRVRAQSVLQANSQARGWGTTTFTGSTSLPEVAETTPEGRVAINPTRLGAAFTKAMSPASVTGTSVTLREVGTGSCASPNGPTVAGAVSYLAPSQAALFLPGSALDVLTRGYVLRLVSGGAGLRDVNNNALDGNLNGAANGTPADDATTCFGDLADATLPTISCSSLLPAALSPDGDGVADTSTFTATLGDDASLKSWRVQVRDEATGALVRTLSKVQSAPGSDALTWDGKNDLGQVVPNGNYVLSASALDSSDNRSLPCSRGLTVSSVFDSSELSPP